MISLKLLSALDQSVNYVEERGPGQAIESRWVVRGDRGIIYLSSQTACAQGCKMCWLTATGQTIPVDLSRRDIYRRAIKLYEEHHTPDIKRLHFNFMARGEFFANKYLRAEGEAEGLVKDLLSIPAGYREREVATRVLISTIMPKTLKAELPEIFVNHHPEIYYSLYTTVHDTHETWSPSAINPFVALAKLKTWQDFSAKIPKIHLALIKDVNDDLSDWERIADAVHESGLRCDFNLVRYNPPNQDTQEASDVYAKAAQFFGAQVVNRVGSDVYASCGMFYGGSNE